MGIIQGFKTRLKRARLSTDFWLHSQKSGFDRRIPPPSINYNQLLSASYAQYYRDFVSDVVSRELPELLKIANFSETNADFAMLDYGCGLGRSAFAFTEHFRSNPNRRYYGYEIHPVAYAFLTKA
jgi:SAM-dependent methyltransferase